MSHLIGGRGGRGSGTLDHGANVPRIGHIGDDPQDARALIATADRCLAEWACRQLGQARITICEEAPDMRGAVTLAGDLRPDVCLLDVALPGGAVTALEVIRERVPATRVVMLAPSADDPALLDAVSAGASGCLVGTPDPPAVSRALADVLAGGTALPRALLTRLVSALAPA